MVSACLIGSFCFEVVAKVRMEFKLEEFVANLSIERLEKCKKADLILIDSSFDVHVPPNVKKKKLQELLYENLGKRGLISEPAPVVGVELGDLAGIHAPLPIPQSQTGMTAEDLRLILRIRGDGGETPGVGGGSHAPESKGSGVRARSCCSCQSFIHVDIHAQSP